MKTLLVEDEAVTRRLVETVLRERGHEVTACADGESAWDAYRKDSYELVVLDWVLPGIDGLQLCRQIRALPHGDASLIVVLTARDQTQDLQAMLDAGADDYLTKSVDIPRLNVRLSIAERQARNLTQRKAAEAQLADIMTQLRSSRDDLVSMLNQLRIGSVLTDEHGRITFISQMCQRLLGRQSAGALGQQWDALYPFDEAEQQKLRTMSALPENERTKVPAHLQAPDGVHYWVEVEIKDDPRHAERKIFFFYDVTETHDLRQRLTDKMRFEDLIGKSESMALVFQQIRDVAAVDTTVLIEGETGTGKELVARAIHAHSRRHAGPFIAVNCAGLTESLLGSQLFGHKRGAFTGAIADHVGLFEAANGGTLFLDEIGDIPLTVQTSLLRVLQEREIVRLGESAPRKIDVRVLGATHHRLADDVAKGTFRSDLLYRIRVARIHLPPLRERREDIPLLVPAFLNQCSAETGKHLEDVSHEAMRCLLAYDWPGNVRELRSAIEFALIRCKSSVIECADLPSEVVGPPRPEAVVSAQVDDDTRRVLAALDRAKGNRAVAARLLGISRATLYRRLSEFNIPPK